MEELNPGDALEPEGRGTGESPHSWQGQPVPGVYHSTTWHALCLGMPHAQLGHLPAHHQLTGAPMTQQCPCGFSLHLYPAQGAISCFQGLVLGSFFHCSKLASVFGSGPGSLLCPTAPQALPAPVPPLPGELTHLIAGCHPSASTGVTPSSLLPPHHCECCCQHWQQGLLLKDMGPDPRHDLILSLQGVQ